MGLGGQEVQVAHMPHDPRWIEVFHEGPWLATASPSAELDADARRRALERRREDARALLTWARGARRRAPIRMAPITAPGEIQELPPSRRTGPTSPRTGRATLRLLGLEGAINRPLDEATNQSGAEERKWGR